MLKTLLKFGKLSRIFFIFVCPLGEKVPAWASHSWSRPTRPMNVGEYEFCLLSTRRGNHESKNDLTSNSARIKPYGPQLQNRWFKYDRVSNIFLTNFFFTLVTLIACVAGPRKNGHARGGHARCLPCSHSFSLAPTTSKRLLRNLWHLELSSARLPVKVFKTLNDLQSYILRKFRNRKNPAAGSTIICRLRKVKRFWNAL